MSQFDQRKKYGAGKLEEKADAGRKDHEPDMGSHSVRHKIGKPMKRMPHPPMHPMPGMGGA